MEMYTSETEWQYLSHYLQLNFLQFPTPQQNMSNFKIKTCRKCPSCRIVLFNQILALLKFKRILETSQIYIGLWFIHLLCKLRSAEAKLSLKPTSCRSGSVHGANIYTVQVVTELREKKIKCNLLTHQQELNPRVMMWGARLEKTENFKPRIFSKTIIRMFGHYLPKR